MMRVGAVARIQIAASWIAVCVTMAGCASHSRTDSAAFGSASNPDMLEYVASQSLPDFEKNRRAEADEYLAARADLPSEIRQAVLEGKVILGMCPEDARAAGGRCEMAYMADPIWGENPDPLELALAQRDRPDSSWISLRFQNRTQFDSREPVAFSVSFAKGRVVGIERD